ncbi:N-formylglutamate amidohydrolase [Marivirga sp. S37H4]|uniref:N-formylglutamate amidohydrolase n=1 Tax=Marivirga aurantiaca TaxID=2802615 RepID=A0A934WYW1_9BACT|nr:N-formylglutamate amidohydrolase [Marivirga aurantiaca]MBK6265402.1 N-formylglutamate amidohydrolase [Marivirga aurantiaca]
MIKYLVSCEHGGNQIPTTYKADFMAHEEILQSHRGWDKGALLCALLISKRLNYPIYYNEVSRLLVECNRTLSHPDLFSFISKEYSDAIKETIINQYYLPYRNKLETFIKGNIEQGHQVVHLSIHSFTPILNGETRKTEIGILFDPARSVETMFALKWQKRILKKNDTWRVKLNYPYLGTDDGLTTYFRELFPENYAGLELEINQKLFDCYPTHQVSNMVIPNFKFEVIFD